jgi:galactitol-specific phosphotransferase system IIC component
MKIIKLFLPLGVHVFGLLHLFSACLSILVSGLYVLYHNFYCTLSSHLQSKTLISGVDTDRTPHSQPQKVG